MGPNSNVPQILQCKVCAVRHGHPEGVARFSPQHSCPEVCGISTRKDRGERRRSLFQPSHRILSKLMTRHTPKIHETDQASRSIDEASPPSTAGFENPVSGTLAAATLHLYAFVSGRHFPVLQRFPAR